MSRSWRKPHWDKTKGHKFFKRMLARNFRHREHEALKKGDEVPIRKRVGYYG